MKPFQFFVAAILFWSQSSAQTNTFPSTGNVGIGTMSPGALFQVHNASIPVFRLSNSTYSADFKQDSYMTTLEASAGFILNWGGANRSTMRFENSTTTAKFYLSGTYGAFANGWGGFNVGHLEKFGFFSHGSTNAYLAIGCVRTDNNNWGLTFSSKNAGTDIEAMRITNTGNVGIGTTNPGAPLEVYKSNSGALGGQIVLNNLGVAVGDQTALSFASGGVANSRAQIQSTVEGAPYYGTLEFITGMKGTPASWTEKMKITGAGNVGIGTSSPSQKLEVSGNIKSTGFILPTGAGAGKILTSDASGNASWQPAASAGWSFDGNTVGVLKKFGTTDNYALPFITNNVERMRIGANGNIGIGSININDANYKLFVETGIRTRKVKIDQITWADYVFHPSYQLPPLTEVEAFIKQHQHLPDIPSAAEVEKNGIDLGDNQAALLKKIEELTLYVIQQQKEINELKTTISKKK